MSGAVEVLNQLPVDHCYRHGFVHSDVVRTFTGWDGRCWDSSSSRLAHPRPLGGVIIQAVVPAVEALIGEGSYTSPWADWQLDLVKAFVGRLNELIDSEERNKTRNRPENFAGTGPAPRGGHTPSNEGGGSCEG